MNNEDRKNDYIKAANEFWRWELAGNSLLKAASYLQKIHNKQSEKMMDRINNGCMYIPYVSGVDQQAHYLQGKCLEVYFKGMYLKAGNSIVDGNGLFLLKGHNLKEVCKIINFNINESEEKTLDKFTEAVIFWGTYPVPLSYLKWRPDHGNIVGLQPIYVWGKNDDKNFSRIISRIKKYYKNNTVA